MNILTLQISTEHLFPKVQRKKITQVHAYKGGVDLLTWKLSLILLEKKIGGLSYEYIPLTPREIEQHLAMYTTQGLNPVPQLKMKSKSQSSQFMQGNDFVFICIGENLNKKKQKT